MERTFDSQAHRLNSALAQLNRSFMQRSQAGVRPGTAVGGYYTNITGRGGRAAYDIGLVGRRIGRGPVQVSPAGGRTTKVLTAAFQKILSAQLQLAQLKAELDRLKKGK
jgi:hypothetical protein